jgi:HAD superfamily hydrolase (TIGR01450 family)
MPLSDASAATISLVEDASIDWTAIDTVLCDLDGVVWLAHRPIDGSVDAIARMRSSGRRVLFVTNNSAAVERDHELALEAIGIPAVGDVVSSAMAAAMLVEPGERVLVAGGPGVVEALVARGVQVVLNDGHGDPDGFDAVVVGLHRDFDFDRLVVASAAVRSGARLIGTNTDSTYPTPSGLQPGGGAILAAVAAASGVEPLIAGKPNQAMVTVIDERLSAAEHRFEGGRSLMVGDRPETDGLFAQRLGSRFALVRTGVTGVADRIPHDVAVDLDVVDLRAVADRLALPT